LTDLKQSTQNILYHLLPAVFWLLAVGGSLVPVFNSPFSILHSPFSTLHSQYLIGYAVAIVALVCIFIVSRIKRHTNSVEECFQVALLLGIAAYWLPWVLLMILPVWGYLIYRNLFSFRSFLSTLIGLAVVAVWIFVLFQLSILNPPFSLLPSPFSILNYIPVISFLLAWLASAVARNILKVR